MDGQIDGWRVNGWTDRWINTTDSWTNGLMDACKDRWRDCWINGWRERSHTNRNTPSISLLYDVWSLDKDSKDAYSTLHCE